jgi:YD repeat-containing protein
VEEGSALRVAQGVSADGWSYTGNFLNGITSRNWSFDDTANGERSVWYAGPVQGNHLEGDVDQDGCVNDTDCLAVFFAYGAGPSYTGPEDLDGDGWVDDDDLLIVMFNFGSYLWTYEYDVWGNLTRATSACAGTYEAGYDALGRRVWQKVSIPNEDPVETYFLYDGDTLIAEVAEIDDKVVQ